jgi:hypothetical protein
MHIDTTVAASEKIDDAVPTLVTLQPTLNPGPIYDKRIGRAMHFAPDLQDYLGDRY